MEEKIIIICVDRDNDLGAKANLTTPIIGRESVLDAATKLALSDPEEADANVLFYGIKLYDELSSKGKNVEIAAIAGDENIGYTSDLKISEQIDEVIKNTKARACIFVSDGAEDEHVLPIIQSKIKILSIERVIIKQSEALESTYYVIRDFIEEIISEPELARIFFGIPALVLLVYMLFGANSWRIISGIVGIFLFIKAFNLEPTIERAIKSIKESFVSGKASFFTYITGAIILIIGVLRGYTRMKTYESLSYKGIPHFISASIDLITISLLLIILGLIIDAAIEKRKINRYILLGIFIVSLRFILNALSDFLLNLITITELSIFILIGISLPLLGLVLLRREKKEKSAAAE